MNFASFLSRYPAVRLATVDDNPALLAFYNSLQMAGGAFNIVFVKDPDYFRFLRYEGEETYVLIIENSANEIEGMATLAIRPCYRNGQRERVGHFSDLRFKRRRDRENKFDWKTFVIDVLENAHEVDELKGCNTWLGSFVMANEFARKAFTAQETPFDISPVANYQMVNLLMRRPFATAKMRRYASAFDGSVARATDADLPAIERFLDDQSRRRELGFVYAGDESELRRRLRDWDGFRPDSIFVARDAGGTIKGCLAPWDPSAGRRIVVDRFPPALVPLTKVAKVMGRRIPTAGDSLDILYLTTQELALDLSPEEQRGVFVSLLNAIYEALPVADYHMVAATDYAVGSMLDVLDATHFTQKTPTLLYQMHLPGASHVLNEDRLRYRAGHEMCLT